MDRSITLVVRPDSALGACTATWTLDQPSEYYDMGLFTLRAMPGDGWAFDHWEDADGTLLYEEAEIQVWLWYGETYAAVFRAPHQHTGMPLYGASGAIIHGSDGSILCSA